MTRNENNTENRLRHFATPTYNAQCKTWKHALGLIGVELEPGQGFATRGNDPLVSFRAFRQYRTERVNKFRVIVARSYKLQRKGIPCKRNNLTGNCFQILVTLTR